MYSVEFTKTAEKELNKLPDFVHDRILLTLDRIRVNPFRPIKRKQGTPYFILRIGNYRAILDVKQNKLLILVLEVGPRGKIYKDRR